MNRSEGSRLELIVSVEETAATWFARVRSGKMSEADEQAFADWLSADLHHLEAYEDVSAAWSQIEAVRLDPTILRLREAALTHAKHIAWWKRSRLGAGLLAGAVAVVCALGLFLTGFSSYDHATIYSSKTGETSRLPLPDGSVVVLDTNSSIKIWTRQTGERRLEMLRGRAFFEVAKNKARPFVVRVGRGSVTALGTQFEVSVRPHGMKVVLLEGKVRVAPVTPAATKPMEMVPGEEIVNDGREFRMSRVDPGVATSWRYGTLIFDEQPLAQVVNELNRYSQQKITIADPAVGGKPVSAVLKAGDPDALLQALESMKIARVDRDDAGGITIRAP